MDLTGFHAHALVRGLVLFGSSCLALIAIQQVPPSNWLMPVARHDGVLRFIPSEATIQKDITSASNRTITLHLGENSQSYSVRELGYQVDAAKTLEQYEYGSRVMRLIPFYSVYKMMSSHQITYSSSEKSATIVLGLLADGVNNEPKNASIKIDQTTVTIDPSEQGHQVDIAEAFRLVSEAVNQRYAETTLPVKISEPDITTSELEKATMNFISTLPDSIDLEIEAQLTSVEKQSMLSWMKFTAKEGRPIIDFDPEKVQVYADSLVTRFAKSSPPTPTIVSITDGKETGRISGLPGKSIDGDNLSQQILATLEGAQKKVTAKLIDVASPIKYTRTYTKSPAGLQDLLDQITAGKEISIRYVDINERGWDIGSRQNTKSRMASTYKLFVVYSTLKRIDAGSIKMTDMINGYTFDVCMQKIIIDSNNECSIAIADKIGWATIQNEGKALGASGLDWKDELYGTVTDASIVPIKLARGEILTESSRNYMLDLMKRQRFRSGIPAGTSYEVADKVGFIDGWLNDSAIIYAPEMTHVLAIYTYNESWATIAEITRQIEAIAL